MIPSIERVGETNVIHSPGVSVTITGLQRLHDSFHDGLRFLRELGLNLIPLDSRGKKPLSEWQQYQTRRMSPGEFDLVSNGRECNVGVICGETSGNLAIVDVDGELPKALVNLIDRTLVAKTGKGYHLYFKTRNLPPNFKTQIDGINIDVKSQGGYAVAPPSIHESGHIYQFLDHTKNILEIDSLEQIGIKPTRPVLEPLPPGERIEVKPWRRMPADIQGLFRSVPEGERNTHAHLLSCTMINEWKFDQDAALEWLKVWNQENSPPLDVRELETVLDSAIRGEYVYGLDKNGISEEILAPTTIGKVAEILSAVIKHDEAVKRYVFLGMLLAFTEEDQPTIIMTGESSTGKSWVVLRIAELFPSEDVELIGYSSPTAFFYEKGTWDEKRHVNVINRERKIIVFLDMPHAKLLERLRPSLSHDRKILTYKSTKVKQAGLMKAELIGYFTTLFLSGQLNLDQQDRTRAYLLAAGDDAEKIKETLQLKAEYDADPAAFNASLDADPERQWLKRRITEIRNLKVRYIKVPFAKELAKEWIKEHATLKPRDQRDFPRLIATVKALALLNAHHRNLDNNHDITATRDDAEEAKNLYALISTSNELGLSAHTYDLLRDVIYSLTKEDNHPSRRDIQQTYYNHKHRALSEKWLENELGNLISVGLIVEDKSTKPYRYSITEAGQAAVEKGGLKV
jgi:hypothetical protein